MYACDVYFNKDQSIKYTRQTMKSVVDEATDQRWNRLDASVRAQEGHFHQLLWHCLSRVSWLH